MKITELKSSQASISTLAARMARENTKQTEEMWLELLAEYIIEKKLPAYYKYTETNHMFFPNAEGYSIEIPTANGTKNPKAAEYGTSSQALLYVSSSKPYSKEIISNIIVNNIDFEECLNAENIPLPEFWYKSTEKKGVRKKQLDYLRKLVEKLYPENCMELPEGAKSILKELCEKNNVLFKPNSFKKVWSDAISAGFVMTKKHDIYIGK